MFLAVLFIVDEKWKQPKCPSTDECINKMWYVSIQWNIMQPTIKSIEVLTHATT